MYKKVFAVACLSLALVGGCSVSKEERAVMEITDRMRNNLIVDILGQGEYQNESGEKCNGPEAEYPSFYGGKILSDDGTLTVYIRDDSENVVNYVKDIISNAENPYVSKTDIEYIQTDYSLSDLYKSMNAIKEKCSGNLNDLTDTVDLKSRLSASELNVEKGRLYFHIRNLTKEESEQLNKEFKDFAGVEFVEATLEATTS